MQYVFVFCWILLSNLSTAQVNEGYRLYTVNDQDKSLWAICQRHQVSVEAVQTLNQLEDSVIRVGQQLKLPNSSAASVSYFNHTTSKKDKSLWRICQRYDVELEQVQALNQLSSTAIQVGQILKIPATHLLIHTVSRQDKSLWRICKNYKIDLKALKAFNQKKNNTIRRGERLLIPKKWLASTPKEPTNTESLFPIQHFQSKFPFRLKKYFSISPSTSITAQHKIDSATLKKLFSNKKLSPTSSYYYYSIEHPFLLDFATFDYLTATQQTKATAGYSYDFVSIIEFDHQSNRLEILPIFLYKNHFGDVEPYLGTPKIGSVACCDEAHPLAYYQKTLQKESYAHSKLLTPSILQYTEVHIYLQCPRRDQVDSSIVILQLETIDIPSFIDREVYKNGQKIETFKHHRRREKLGY